MWWLGQGQNSSAIQAVSAAVVAFFTLILILLTGWYARITRFMSRTMEKQLQAAFQPSVGITYTHHFRGQGVDREGVKSESVFSYVQLRNDCESPIKIHAVKMFIFTGDPRFYDKEATLDQSGLILAPEKTKDFRISIDVDKGTTEIDYRRIFMVHCTDLAGVSEHSFQCEGGTTDITHTFGFRRPPSRVKFYLLKLLGRRGRV
jgi:hypothetical protein